MPSFLCRAYTSLVVLNSDEAGVLFLSSAACVALDQALCSGQTRPTGEEAYHALDIGTSVNQIDPFLAPNFAELPSIN